MQLIQTLFQYFIDLGMFVTFPLIILLLSLLAGLPLKRAFLSAALTGIGFVGIFLVIDLLVSTLGDVVHGLIGNLGLQLDVVDVGWPVAALVALSNTQIVAWVYLTGVLLNVLLLAIGFTRTLDVDLFNYWHFMFAAAVVGQVTGQLWPAVVVALLMLVICLLLADWTAPVVADVFQMKGVSFPHASTIPWAPLGLLIDRLLDRAGWIRNRNVTPASLRQRFGLAGEPAFLGIIIGFVLSVLAFFPQLGAQPGAAVRNVLQSTIQLGAVIVIMPRMANILMEGLLPFSEGVRGFLQRRFPGRELYIGIDAAAAIGQESVIVTGMILVPIVLVLAIIMNAVGLNRMLPYADLVALPFFAIWAVGWNRGNMVRAILTGTIFSAIMLFIATDLAPITTQIGLIVKPDVVPLGLQVSTISIGAEALAWVMTLPFRLMPTGAAVATTLGIAALIVGGLKLVLRPKVGPHASGES